MVTSFIAVLLLFTSFVTPVFAATELVDLSSEGTIGTTETKIHITTIDNEIYCMDVIAKACLHGA